MSKIIPIDHGNRMMKTLRHVFPASYMEGSSIAGGDVLKYQGKTFFLVSLFKFNSLTCGSSVFSYEVIFPLTRLCRNVNRRVHQDHPLQSFQSGIRKALVKASNSDKGPAGKWLYPHYPG